MRGVPLVLACSSHSRENSVEKNSLNAAGCQPVRRHRMLLVTAVAAPEGWLAYKKHKKHYIVMVGKDFIVVKKKEKHGALLILILYLEYMQK